MPCVKTAGKIRQAHFREGRSINAISRDLEVSRATVRKELRSGAMEFAYEGRTTPPSTSPPRTHPKSSGSRSGAAACARGTAETHYPRVRGRTRLHRRVPSLQRQSLPGVLKLWAVLKIFAPRILFHRTMEADE